MRETASATTEEFLEAASRARQRPVVSSKHLAVFVACYGARSISDAADSLFASQSSTSRTLATLERRLGVDLFLRTPRGLEPTDAGHSFHAAAVAAHESIDAAINAVVPFNTPTALNVGFIRELLSFAAGSVAAYSETHPMGHLAIESAAALIDMVRSGALDVAFVIGLGDQLPQDLEPAAVRKIEFALHRPESGHRADIIALPARGTWERATLDGTVLSDYPGPSFESSGGSALRRLLQEGFSTYIPLCCAGDIPDVDVIEPIYTVSVFSISRKPALDTTRVCSFVEILAALPVPSPR